MDHTKLKGCHPGGDPVGLKGPDGMNTLSSYQAGRDDMITIIKSEIERQKTINKSLLELQLKDGCLYAFNQVLNFLSTLESEKPVPNDLEEAAENYIAPIENDEGLDYINFNGRDIKDAFIAGAKWQKQHDAELIEIAYNDGITIGMTKQKEQMMKKAVEGYVVKDITGSLAVTAKGINLDGFKFGDKVRVIILPKED